MQTPRSTLAYETIKKAIDSGEILPGSQLLEANLCSSLQMSRTPIREALNKLAAEGYLEHAAGCGFTATVYTVDKVKKIYEKIEAIEGMLAYILAENNSKVDLFKLDAAVSGMEESLKNGDSSRWAYFDNEFHNVMYASCDNEYIMKDLVFLSHPSRHIRDMITTVYLDKSISTKSHRYVCDAIKSGDAESARREAQNHFRWVRKEVIACMQRFNIN